MGTRNWLLSGTVRMESQFLGQSVHATLLPSKLRVKLSLADLDPAPNKIEGQIVPGKFGPTTLTNRLMG